MGQGGAQPHRLGGSEWVEVGLSPIDWGLRVGQGGSQPHRLGGSEWVRVRHSPIGSGLSPTGWGSLNRLRWVSAL